MKIIPAIGANPYNIPPLGAWRASIAADDKTVTITEVRPIIAGFNIGDAKQLNVGRKIDCVDRDTALLIATRVNTR